MGKRGKELILHPPDPLRFRPGRAFGLDELLPLQGHPANVVVEPGVVDGDPCLCGDAHDNALCPVAEHARVRMPEEKPADGVASAGDDRHGQIAAHR